MSELNPVAWRYEYTYEGCDYDEFSAAPFIDSWVLARKAKVTPLYTHPLPDLSDKQWRSLLVVMGNAWASAEIPCTNKEIAAAARKFMEGLR